MGKGNFKKEKYQDLLLNELNRIIRTELSDARLTFVSITKVELSHDYSIANIFWDTFETNKRGDAKAAITSASPRMKKILSQNLDVRTIPELRFSYDSQFEDEQKIDELLKSDQND